MKTCQLELDEQWKILENQFEPILKLMKKNWIGSDSSLGKSFEEYALKSANERQEFNILNCPQISKQMIFSLISFRV